MAEHHETSRRSPRARSSWRSSAAALEQGQPFTIQVANERFAVPADAEMSVEHERGEDGEELELQLRWRRRG